MIELKTKYEPLKVIHEKSINGGRIFYRNQWIFKFPNNYGASVICNKANKRFVSYGNKDKPYEIALIYFTEQDNYTWCLSYQRSYFEDVIGFLTQDEVEEYLEKIERIKEWK